MATSELDPPPLPPPMKVVVIGGTGEIGRCLVGALLQAKERIEAVTLIGRRKLEIVPEQYKVDLAAEEASGRLKQHVQDLDAVTEDTVKELSAGYQVFFNTLGTTRRQAGSAEAFRHIDLEIPLKLIRAAREAGVPHCSVVSSLGADQNSWFLYMKTKGEIEEAVRQLSFPITTIFRPGVLGRTNPSLGEKKHFSASANIFDRYGCSPLKCMIRGKQVPLASVGQSRRVSIKGTIL
eukprot:Em0009g1293a